MRFHSANTAFEHFGDFLVAEPFEVAENHGAAKNIGNLLQRALHDGLNFVRGKLLERRSAEVRNFEGGLPILGSGVNGDVFLQMALEPALVSGLTANRINLPYASELYLAFNISSQFSSTSALL